MARGLDQDLFPREIESPACVWRNLALSLSNPYKFSTSYIAGAKLSGGAKSSDKIMQLQWLWLMWE